MRSLCVITITLAAVLGACNSRQWPEPSRTTMNSWSVNEYHRDSIEAAIVSQHTLYPYHFVRNSAELNELGERDLNVLARHYSDHPGRLNLRRADTVADLYDARLETVRARLADRGVDLDRVRIADHAPGGDGMSSDRVLLILDEKMDQPLTDKDTLSTFRSN